MDEHEQLYNPINFSPVDFGTDNYFQHDDRNYNHTYSPIPINIIASPPPNYNNNKTTKCFNNKTKEDLLKSVITNTPNRMKNNENVYVEQRGSNHNNNKRKNNSYKNTFHMRNTNYNKNSKQNINNNNNNNNLTVRNFRDTKDLRIAFEVQRRVSGLMERFKSKAKLYDILKNPPNFLIEHCKCNALNQAIWNLYSSRVQKKKTYLRKLDLWKTTYLSLNQIFYKYSLFIVGSTMCGFSTDNSDIDMCLIIKSYTDDMRKEELTYLQHIQFVLQQSSNNFIESAELILAKVPILKLISAEQGFEVDLNCNNAVGIRNTHLMNCYAQLDWRVRPLVIIVKLWAQSNNINDAKNKTISSYSLVLMVIHYLQCGVFPPILPCLHGIYPDKFNPYTDIHKLDIQEELPACHSDNKQCLGELFIGFLRYYSFLDYDGLAISVRQGTVVNKDECRYSRSHKNTATQWKLLCIEEPFDLTNTAKSVYDIEAFEHIKYVFLMSYKLLNETKNLNRIFPCVITYKNKNVGGNVDNYI